ncbi:MAG TPA: 2-oxoacid:acceptor oxidoreductase family protein [Methanomassiliicoccales archaeon]|nr:2-oxoacid:acceptor oxidoreductase family protein [Methanomassiliicoccales archaeon]
MKATVRFAGMGGQGIIFAGIVLARAAALYESRNRPMFAVQTQSYGPAARGESSKCDVVLSEEESFYPFVDRPDFLVVMSQPAYERFIDQTHSGTVVILEKESVEGRPDLTYYDVPAIAKARELEERGPPNMIMLGALVGITDLVSQDSAIDAIEDVSPVDAVDGNMEAFREGVRLGRSMVYHE